MYDTTWVQANAPAGGVAAGQGGLYVFGAAVVSRRLLMLGGENNDGSSADLCSVYQAFW